MTTYYSGGSALAGARIDLGHVVGKWWEYYGVGPESYYVATRACSDFFVSKAGDYALYGKDWVKDEQIGDLGNEYKRQPGEPTPKGKPATVANVNLSPISYGKAAEWDDDEPIVRELLDQGGLALVEEVYLRASLGHMALGMDYDLYTALAALTLTGQTQAATAAQWSTASSGLPVTHITAVLAGMKVDPDSCILSRKSAVYMRQCAEMTTLFGGTAGVGRLGEAQFIEGLASLGIRNVYIGETDIWADVMWLYKKGSNPVFDPSGIIRGVIRKDGADERGILVQTKDSADNFAGHEVYASCTCDFALDTDLIGSVTDIY